ncbi:MAG: hypothetical protein ACRC33_29340 [Gemmataceae bacterium]
MVEPLKPAARQSILAAAPAATEADVEEYERLLSKRYTKDPSAGRAAAAAPDPDEARLKQLIHKLFGPS